MRASSFWSAKASAILVVIVCTATLLRFWKLGWGLSAGLYFPDERQIWTPYFLAFDPVQWTSFLRPDRPMAFVYPSFFGNLSGLGAALGRTLGGTAPPEINIFDSLHIARLVAASGSLLTVGFVALAGTRLFDSRTGLAAGLLAAVVPMEAIQAHYANVDSLLVCLVAAQLFVATQIATTGSRGWALAGGWIAGLAFGTKYTGLALTSLVAWAALEVAMQQRSLRPIVPAAIGGLIGFALGFASACPACLIQHERWIEALRLLTVASDPARVFLGEDSLVPTLGWLGRPGLWQIFAALPFMLGWPLWLLSMAGVLLAILRHGRADRILLLAIAVFLLPMATSTVDAVRYVLPLGPALVILAARAATAIPGRSLRLGLLGSIFLYSLTLGLSQVSRLNYEQQGAVAHWLRTEVQPRPDDASTPITAPTELWHYYRLAEPTRQAGVRITPLPPERWFESGVEVVVLPEPYIVRMQRSYSDSSRALAVARLIAGEGGYREVARWESDYFDRASYVRLDPSFAGDLLLGEIGFRIYRRPRTGDASSNPAGSVQPPTR